MSPGRAGGQRWGWRDGRGRGHFCGRETPAAWLSLPGWFRRWLGIASFGVPEKLGCAGLPLSGRQKELCKRKPHLLPSIREGARLGIQECRSQFRHERWNCLLLPPDSDFSVFGAELSSGESAGAGGGGSRAR